MNGAMPLSPFLLFLEWGVPLVFAAESETGNSRRSNARKYVLIQVRTPFPLDPAHVQPPELEEEDEDELWEVATFEGEFVSRCPTWSLFCSSSR